MQSSAMRRWLRSSSRGALGKNGDRIVELGALLRAGPRRRCSKLELLRSSQQHGSRGLHRTQAGLPLVEADFDSRTHA